MPNALGVIFVLLAMLAIFALVMVFNFRLIRNARERVDEGQGLDSALDASRMDGRTVARLRRSQATRLSSRREGR